MANGDPTKDITTRLQNISTPDAADQLRKLGVSRTVLKGIRPLTPTRGTIAGRARTLRLLPEREDLKTPPDGPVNRGLYDSIATGQVLVLDAVGVDGQAVLGDMMFSRLAALRAAAVIVDGAVRDIPVVSAKELPVFARC
jgi:5-oxopent-3-ene-1,2,5-tricarboxylate decarboxylase / 2-hydroxyhepta-2,4-diene-1,7-dioate isomerase